MINQPLAQIFIAQTAMKYVVTNKALRFPHAVVAGTGLRLAQKYQERVNFESRHNVPALTHLLSL